ncbi:MAG: GNAT family N-acetyltransferase [Betaproteobacteria bacterium]|nr:GNAT family N-acetyltransferase [Betaproteobacteria bacterium]
MKDLLPNIFWHALTGPQARFAAGARGARRFARGFSPILAFADQRAPDFAALLPHCDPGERFYVDGWAGPVPEGWTLEAESAMFKMVWEGAMPAEDAAPEALPLGLQHVARALALAELTHPGPFGPRTIELGEYFGLFEAGRLVAMAGERTEAGTLREISGVCTHPAHQGKGLAKRLMLKLIARQMRRGLTPFLHVMRDNAGARSLYRRMGFTEFMESPVRVLTMRNA